MADRLVRTLNGLGYQPVFLPRGGVVPAELWYYKRGDGAAGSRLVRLGPLAPMLPAVAQLEVTEGELGDINAQYTSEKKIGAAVSFLKEALACIGISAVPKIELGFAGSTDFAFAFTGVRYRAIDPVQLFPIIGQLQTAGLPPGYVEDGLLHIVYEYAYASELLLSRGDKREFSTDISGQVGAYIDLGAKGSVAMASKSAIAFRSHDSRQAAFAYKAGQLVRNKGTWTFLPEVVSPGAGLVEEARKPFLPQPAIPLHAEIAQL